MRRMRDGVVATGCALTVIGAVSGSVTEAFKVAPSDSGTSDNFGSAVATDGSVLVVGSPGHDGSGTQEGAVYVYDAQLARRTMGVGSPSRTAMA